MEGQGEGGGAGGEMRGHEFSSFLHNPVTYTCTCTIRTYCTL